MLDVVCKLRAQHAIPGPTGDQLEHLRNKAVLKTLVKSKGIPTAKFCILEFPLTSDIPSAVAKINREIGVFPLFRKPVSGCGGGGGGRIENEEELRRWLNDEEQSGNKMIYLVEECLSGREFWASLCLLTNGEWRPLFNLHCGETTVREYLESGRPIPFVARRFEEWEDEFPNLLAFVDKVVKAIQAPHPHLLCIQGFQVQAGTDSYLFTECGYRQNGARGSGASYAACGVAQETALLSCHSDPAYRADADPKWPRIKQFSLWWPYREGVLRSHNPLPTDNLSSTVELNWMVEPGTKLCKAQSFAHFIANTCITNKDWDAGMRDMEWIAANWSPDVIVES
ncbi:hypothetical protein AAVH_32440 [Aphelenchoides avenae]|nr:hypothetical protein AAVH_32440 [Aphelenchus avenae]